MDFPLDLQLIYCHYECEWPQVTHQLTEETYLLSLRKESSFLIRILPHHSPRMRDLTLPFLQTSRFLRNALLSP